MIESDALAIEARGVRDSGALGRSDLIDRLFDFLIRCTLEGRTPKESEVGAAIFGRDPSFDTSRDAVVRVYIHKLRRKLDAVYSGPRRDVAARLNIPRGEYRLVLEPLEGAPSPAPPSEATPAWRPAWGTIALILALVLATIVATWAVCRATLPPAVNQDLALANGPIWGGVTSNRFPTLIVVGDYYIFGESDDGMEVARLVREYTVNSRADLNAFLVRHPDRAMRYVDLDLRYLPVGSAFAIRSLAPLLALGRNPGTPSVILASALTPAMMRQNNIIYIGYFSGLGPLRDTVFAGSRFSVGETYDDLFDRRDRRRYLSEGGGPDSNGQMYRDYGYISSFRGPTGARVVIIAGTRDIGLMQTAEVAASLPALKQLVRRVGPDKAFEALYAVEGMNRQNVGGRLLVASPVDDAVKWRGTPTPARAFPAG